MLKVNRTVGLPIAKSIVELHRGKILVQNTYTDRKPTVLFTFSIPLK